MRRLPPIPPTLIRLNYDIRIECDFLILAGVEVSSKGYEKQPSSSHVAQGRTLILLGHGTGLERRSAHSR